MLKVGFFAVGAVQRDDVVLGKLVNQGDGFVQSDGGFFLLAFVNEFLDFLYLIAGFAFASAVDFVFLFVFADRFDLGFDLRHGLLPFGIVQR